MSKPMPYELTAEEMEAATAEGWFVSEVGGREPFRLERDDAAAVFGGDQQAWEHVIRNAVEGSKLHRKALAFLRDNSAAEFNDILEYAEKTGLPKVDLTDFPAAAPSVAAAP